MIISYMVIIVWNNWRLSRCIQEYFLNISKFILLIILSRYQHVCFDNAVTFIFVFRSLKHQLVIHILTICGGA